MFMALPSSTLVLAARQCGLDVICRTLRERKSRLTPRRVTILPLLFLPSTCLYPPGIARQIKHHLLSERVDLDLSRRPSQGGAPKAFARMNKSASCMRIFPSPLRRRRSTRAIRRGTGERKRTKFAARGFHPRDASARDSVCAKIITHNREDRFSDGFTQTLVTFSSDNRSNLPAIYEAKIKFGSRNARSISKIIMR